MIRSIKIIGYSALLVFSGYVFTNRMNNGIIDIIFFTVPMSMILYKIGEIAEII